MILDNNNFEILYCHEEDNDNTKEFEKFCSVADGCSHCFLYSFRSKKVLAISLSNFKSVKGGTHIFLSSEKDVL